MILQEREILNAAISRKGEKLISEEAVDVLTACADSFRDVLRMIGDKDQPDDEFHEAWQQAEWALASAQIAVDWLRAIYCDDPIDYKRAALLRDEAAEMGLFGRRDDEG